MAYTYTSGIGAVGSYQASGVPWITGSGADGLPAGSEDRIEFPFVTRTVTIINTDAAAGTGNDIRVHFNSTGSGNVVGGEHFVPLTLDQQSIAMNVKCKEIFISMDATLGNVSGSYVVMAELTDIQTQNMFILTGSGLTD